MALAERLRGGACKSNARKSLIEYSKGELMNKIEHYDDEREDGMIFRFTGEIYNRPCGRGIWIGENFDHLDEQIPEGEYEAEIVIRRKGSRDKFRAKVEQSSTQS